MTRETDVLFHDRSDAGVQLAKRLAHLSDESVIVLALPRGGLPVAYEVAQRLGAPLDLMVVRKLGSPMEPELAMGAIASGGIRILNHRVVRDLAIPADAIERVILAEKRELERRERSYRGDRPQPALQGRTVILVDDGIATGSTMRVAVAAALRRGAARVIVAVPVAPADACDALAREGTEVVCVARPASFFGISQFYVIFPQLTDDDVVSILSRAEAEWAAETTAEFADVLALAGAP